MSDKTTCPLCDKSISFAGLPKHIFSSLHKNDLIVGLQKRKEVLTRDIKMFPTTGCIPYIQVKGRHYLHLCFGCNKCYYHRHNFQKQHSCAKLAEGFKVVQSILDAPTLVISKPEAPEVKTTPLLTPGDDKEFKELKMKYDSLTKQCALLNKFNDEAELKAEKADGILEGLKTVLRYVKNKDDEIYDTLCDHFREEHEDLLALVKL